MKTNFILDFQKVIWARLYWRSQEGIILTQCPEAPTVYGRTIDCPNDFAYPLNHDFPSETRLERARRLDIFDTWTIFCEMHSYCLETFKWEGKRAIDMYQAYCRFVMSRNKRTKNK